MIFLDWIPTPFPPFLDIFSKIYDQNILLWNQQNLQCNFLDRKWPPPPSDFFSSEKHPNLSRRSPLRSIMWNMYVFTSWAWPSSLTWGTLLWAWGQRWTPGAWNQRGEGDRVMGKGSRKSRREEGRSWGCCWSWRWRMTSRNLLAGWVTPLSSPLCLAKKRKNRRCPENGLKFNSTSPKIPLLSSWCTLCRWAASTQARALPWTPSSSPPPSPPAGRGRYRRSGFQLFVAMPEDRSLNLSSFPSDCCQPAA